MNGLGYGFSYDEAGQLEMTGAMVAPTSQIPNNSTFSATAPGSLLSLQIYEYDAARNLRSRLFVAPGVIALYDTPPDASGRNRPALAGGEALAYDANGNLTHKGDMAFEYDFRNRLTRVSRSGEEVAAYTYDAFDRRIEKQLGSDTETTVWSGWRPVETYRNGVIEGRQVYGLGLDEIAELQRDLDGDGNLETKGVPWYDSTGNPALLADTAGRIIERYSFTPLGGREIRVDGTEPAIEQLRSRNAQIWIQVNEEVIWESFRAAVDSGAVRLEDTSVDPPVTIETMPEQLEIGEVIGNVELGAVQASSIQPAGAQSRQLAASSVAASSTISGSSLLSTGNRAPVRRRLVLDLTNPPAAGTPLRLVVASDALEDLFLNRPAAEWSTEFTWSDDDTVIFDAAPPQVQLVSLRDGHAEVTFTEEPDLATAGAVDLGTPLTWTLSEDRFTLRSDETLAAGTYALLVGTSLADVAGTVLPSPFTLELTVAGGAPNVNFYERPDPRLIASSAAGNGFGFHGLPVDPQNRLRLRPPPLLRPGDGAVHHGGSARVRRRAESVPVLVERSDQLLRPDGPRSRGLVRRADLHREGDLVLHGRVSPSPACIRGAGRRARPRARRTIQGTGVSTDDVGR